jgi:hypothetical protein
MHERSLVRQRGWVLGERISEKVLRFLEFEDGGILTGGRMSQQDAQKGRPARPQ